MATASGIDAQLGFVAESTFGTFETPTRFLELVSEDLSFGIDRIETQGIRAGRKTRHDWHSGAQRVTGGFEVELAPQGAGLLLEHAFGSLATAGTASPFTHTIIPGPLDGKSLTVQVGRPNIGGTVLAFSYLGCKVVDWELTAEAGNLAMFRTNLYGVHETTGESLASASYPSGYSPFVFTHGSLSIGGTATDVKNISLTGNNGLEVDRHRVSATTPARSKEPLESNLRDYGGQLAADFLNLTMYNRFVGGSEASLILTFAAAAAASLVVTMSAVRFDGDTPNIGGIEIPELTMPFTVGSPTTDAQAITAVLTNADSGA